MIKEPVAGAKLKTKIISVGYYLTSNCGWESLEVCIDKFLNSMPMEVIDMQFSSVMTAEDKGYGYCVPSYEVRSVLIIYK